MLAEPFKVIIIASSKSCPSLVDVLLKERKKRGQM